MAIAGCSLFSKKEIQPAPPNPETVRQFQLGVSALDSEQYEKALKIFDSIAAKDPVSEFEVIVVFNSAASLEGLGQCQEAGKRYRRVGQLTPQRTSKIRAQASFRLSYIYECLNQDTKVISALLEASKRAALFSPEIAQAEIPARLAAAYARLGEMKMAQKYLDEAERGMISLQAIWENSAQKKDLMAKTYYLMGRPQVAKIEIEPRVPHTFLSYERFAQNLDLLQGYLLRSVFLGSETWSKRAYEELLESHDILWNKLNDLTKIPAAEVDYQVIQQAKAKLAERAVRSLDTLQLMRLPDKDEPALVGQLFAEAERKEKRLRTYISKLGPTNPLTSEAKSRQSIKKAGKVLSGRTALESESLSRELPAKKKK